MLSNTTSSEDKGLPCQKQSLHGIMTSIHQYVPKRIKREILLSLSNFSSPGGEIDAEDEASTLESLRHNCCLKKSLFLSPAAKHCWRQEGYGGVLIVGANTVHINFDK